MMSGVDMEGLDLPVTAFTASFGPDPAPAPSTAKTTKTRHPTNPLLRFTKPGGNPLHPSPASNPLGCAPYPPNTVPPNAVLLVHRGTCTFVEKLAHAAGAGASGVIVVNTDDQGVNPSAEREDVAKAGGAIEGAVLVVVPRSAGEEILKVVEVAGRYGGGGGGVMVEVVREEKGEEGAVAAAAAKRRRRQSVEENRILYLNGHPLLNTRLLV
jgi:mannosidase alpha-like ER degradation enhancer 1